MLWIVLLAGLLPLPLAERNEARILLMRAELWKVEGPGLQRFDQAAMAFAHTGKRIEAVQEPRLGRCLAGQAAGGEVQGYLAGAAPLLRRQLPGEGIRLAIAPAVATGGVQRTVSPVSGAAGVYAATIGGSRMGVAAEAPLFFGPGIVEVRVGESAFGMDGPREFIWPERETPSVVQRNKDYELRWSGTGDGEMWVGLASAAKDRSAAWVVCVEAAAKRRLTIPATHLGKLPASEGATLLLGWLPKGVWKKHPLESFPEAQAAAVHVQGATVGVR